MKKSLLVIFVAVFTFVSCFYLTSLFDKNKTASSNNNITSPYTIVIDAGHGGKDVGTIGIDGTNEKDINLAISLMLFDYLMVSGINTQMTRYGDYEVYEEDEERTRSDLYNRLDLINSINNSILISIHQNHFEDEKEWGTQIWYSANTTESKAMADSILSIVKKYVQPENKRENKESGSSYYLLYKASVPSIMVECGFMSNKRENDLLKNNEYQSKFAYAILLGLNGELNNGRQK